MGQTSLDISRVCTHFSWAITLKLLTSQLALLGGAPLYDLGQLQVCRPRWNAVFWTMSEQCRISWLFLSSLLVSSLSATGADIYDLVATAHSWPMGNSNHLLKAMNLLQLAISKLCAPIWDLGVWFLEPN